MDLMIEPFDTNKHERNTFDCGIEVLNSYLKCHANQNQSANITRAYVAVSAKEHQQSKTIYGYYTLSASHIIWDNLPDVLKKRLPKHPIPVARIGRLATDKKYQRRGIGQFLLYSALTNILSHADGLGIYAAVVDAKPEAKQFYLEYGFQPLKEEGLTLYLPVKTLQNAAQNHNQM